MLLRGACIVRTKIRFAYILLLSSARLVDDYVLRFLMKAVVDNCRIGWVPRGRIQWYKSCIVLEQVGGTLSITLVTHVTLPASPTELIPHVSHPTTDTGIVFH